MISWSQQIGFTIQQRRKELELTTLTLAEAAHISRVTLYRIERGEETVSIGHYLNVLDALGLDLSAICKYRETDTSDARIPCRISLSAYPQLQKIAWQLDPDIDISPLTAWQLYDRNRRHIERQTLSKEEQTLISNLEQAFTDV